MNRVLEIAIAIVLFFGVLYVAKLANDSRERTKTEKHQKELKAAFDSGYARCYKETVKIMNYSRFNLSIRDKAFFDAYLLIAAKKDSVQMTSLLEY